MPTATATLFVLFFGAAAAYPGAPAVSITKDVSEHQFNAVCATSWRQCSKSCGDGVQIRRCTNRPQPPAGQGSKVLFETRLCNLGKCFTEPSSASASSTPPRNRVMENTPLPAAVYPWTGDATTWSNWSIDAGEINELTSWGTWSTRTQPCGEGIQIRRPSPNQSLPRLQKMDGTFQTRRYNLGPCATPNYVTKPCRLDDGIYDLLASSRLAIKDKDGSVGDDPSDNGLLPQPHQWDGDDCRVSPYEPWSACSVSCGGGGHQQRVRWVLSLQNHGGAACPPTLQRRSCAAAAAAAPPCSVDCATTRWGPRACSKTCGGGVVQRLRTVRTLSSFGGAACGALREWSSSSWCNARVCPRACVVSGWSAWSNCKLVREEPVSKSQRFRWIQTRSRSVLHSAFFGGEVCPAVMERKECKPVRDCVVDAWKSWGACVFDVSWSQVRSRSTLQRESWGGEACPAVVERKACARPRLSEPRDCVMEQWGAWSSCLVSDVWGGSHTRGTWQTRTRAVLLRTHFGGEACPPTLERNECRSGASFGPWSSIQLFKSFGKTLTGKKSTRAPRLAAMRDCTVAQWGPWTSCSRGHQKRNRAVVYQMSRGGSACPVLFERRECTGWKVMQVRPSLATKLGVDGKTVWRANWKNIESAAKGKVRNCTVGPWSEWTLCSASGPGITSLRLRTRVVLFMETYGGESCPPVVQRRECISGDDGDDNNPEDGGVSGVGAPAGCTRTYETSWTQAECDGSCNQVQRRVVFFKLAVPARVLRGYNQCPPTTESRACPPCNANLAKDTIAKESSTPSSAVAIGCEVGGFGPWDSCSRSCNTGVQIRRRDVQRVHTFGGVACPWLYEARACATQKCPVNCAVSHYSTWGTLRADATPGASPPTVCSRSCGGGVRVRFRDVLRMPAFGGVACPFLKDTELCNAQPCPDDCIVGRWQLKKVVMWPAQSAQDNSELVRRVRDVKRPLKYFGGAACPPLVYSQYLGLAGNIDDAYAELDDLLTRNRMERGLEQWSKTPMPSTVAPKTVDAAAEVPSTVNPAPATAKAAPSRPPRARRSPVVATSL